MTVKIADTKTEMEQISGKRLRWLLLEFLEFVVFIRALHGGRLTKRVIQDSVEYLLHIGT